MAFARILSDFLVADVMAKWPAGEVAAQRQHPGMMAAGGRGGHARNLSGVLGWHRGEDEASETTYEY